MNVETLIQSLKLFAGIGLFLFAIYLIEESLKNLSGRDFKRFLQRVTKSDLGAVIGGAVVTSLLQSSSMVSMMVLAFVGAGIFTLRNAMAIILGANLGTTLASWVVATLGFKVNIEIVAYPVVGIGGLVLILLSSRRTFKYASYFLLGFGLLFIGLAMMKTAMEAQAFDLSKYAHMPLAIFLLIGFIITLLIQSSSVTMALTLSALHAGTITFPIAAAVVLGSETGTSIKLLVGAIGGSAVKKRVALGNFLFNVVLTALFFSMLQLLLRLITGVLGIADPLIGLVAFSSLINVLTIAVFLPFLGPFCRLLEMFYQKSNGSNTAFLSHANANEPQSALDLFRKETQYFLYTSMRFNLSLFEVVTPRYQTDPDFEKLIAQRKLFSRTPDQIYEFLKQTQGEIQSFYIKLRTKFEGPSSRDFERLNAAVRNCMHSVKSIKDIRGNIDNLRRSSKDIKFELFQDQKEFTKDLYQQFNDILRQEEHPATSEFQSLLVTIKHSYNTSLERLYEVADPDVLQNADITTAINFNREIFSSHKAMLIAVKDFAAEEGEIPGFDETLAFES